VSDEQFLSAYCLKLIATLDSYANRTAPSYVPSADGLENDIRCANERFREKNNRDMQLVRNVFRMSDSSKRKSGSGKRAPGEKLRRCLVVARRLDVLLTILEIELAPIVFAWRLLNPSVSSRIEQLFGLSVVLRRSKFVYCC